MGENRKVLKFGVHGTNQAKDGTRGCNPALKKFFGRYISEYKYLNMTRLCVPAHGDRQVRASYVVRICIYTYIYICMYINICKCEYTTGLCVPASGDSQVRAGDVGYSVYYQSDFNPVYVQAIHELRQQRTHAPCQSAQHQVIHMFVHIYV